MDARQLRYFVAIAEQGSFSRAAEQLNIAQPALSLHVRNMESALGAKLLHRGPKGVVPTEVGMVLLRNARVILKQFAATEEEIRGLGKEPSGEVRLGLPGTIGEILSVPLITAVHNRYPKIRLRIAEAMSGYVLDWLRQSRIDMAVIYGRVNDHGLGSVKLAEEELMLFGPLKNDPDFALPPSGHKIKLAQIFELPLIVPGPNHGLRLLLDRHAAGVGAKLSAKIEVDSYVSIKELVRGGIGYSILPTNAVSRDIASGHLRGWRIEESAVMRQVHLAQPVERPVSNAAMAVRELTVEVLQDLIARGIWVGATTAPIDLAAESLPFAGDQETSI